MPIKIRTVVSSVLGLSLLAVVSCAEDNNAGAAAEDCQDTTLEYSTYASGGSDQAETVAWWADELENRTDGALSVNIHTSGSLISADDSLAALRDGRADMAQVAGIYFPSDLPLMGVAEIPFQTTNAEAHMKAVAELATENPDFSQQLDNNEITYIFPIPFDTAVIGSHSPIENTDDLQGLNVRVGGAHNDAYIEVGANPVSLAANEIYEAFTRGVIDGWSGLGMVNATSFGLDETAHVTDAGTGLSSVSAAAMSQETFEGLCQEHQETVLEVGEEATDVGVELLREASAEVCETLQENGAQISVWDEEQTNEWAERVNLEESWVEENSDRYDAQSVLNEFQQLIDEFEEESDFTEPLHECAERN